MKIVVAALIFAALVACAEQLPPSCQKSSDKYYDIAVSRALTRAGIAHTAGAELGVCVPHDLTGKLDAASKEVTTFFFAVARLIEDECEERAFVEWATREKLTFEISDTTKTDVAPYGRMFWLRSFSREEVEPNRDKLLRQSPQGARCKASR